MKRAAVLIVVLLMAGWAVYDMIGKKEAEPESDTATEQDVSSPSVSETDTAGGEAAAEPASTGLQKGDMAPDFELETLGGEAVKLSDYRGKKVLVNFWATWCPPCRAEMPDMEKFYNDKDVEILAVNLTETEGTPGDVQPFVDDFGLTFPILMDTSSDVSSKYRISPIPTSYFIDTKGRIASVSLGAMNYDHMVQTFERME
nr:redoxin domain-containing protein [Bacillus marinisedimentorum]